MKGKYNPLQLRTVTQLSQSVDLVEDNSGKLLVLRFTRLDPRADKKFGLIAFFDKELGLLRQFGIDHVRFDAVSIDRGDEKLPVPSLMLISDYVKGGQITEAPPEQLVGLISGLIKYYRSKFFSKDDFVSDIARPDQYRYGKVGEGDNKIYLVDVDLDHNSVLYPHFRNEREFRVLLELENILGLTGIISDKQQESQVINEIHDFVNDIDISIPVDLNAGNSIAVLGRLKRSILSRSKTI